MDKEVHTDIEQYETEEVSKLTEPTKSLSFIDEMNMFQRKYLNIIDQEDRTIEKNMAEQHGVLFSKKKKKTKKKKSFPSKQASTVRVTISHSSRVALRARPRVVKNKSKSLRYVSLRLRTVKDSLQMSRVLCKIPFLSATYRWKAVVEVTNDRRADVYFSYT